MFNTALEPFSYVSCSLTPDRKSLRRKLSLAKPCVVVNQPVTLFLRRAARALRVFESDEENSRK